MRLRCAVNWFWSGWVYLWAYNRCGFTSPQTVYCGTPNGPLTIFNSAHRAFIMAALICVCIIERKLDLWEPPQKGSLQFLSILTHTHNHAHTYWPCCCFYLLHNDPNFQSLIRAKEPLLIQRWKHYQTSPSFLTQIRELPYFSSSIFSFFFRRLLHLFYFGLLHSSFPHIFSWTPTNCPGQSSKAKGFCVN